MSREPDCDTLSSRAETILRDHQQQIYIRTDRMFAVLMVLQWLSAIAAAVWLSPTTWSGSHSSVHPHVWLAILFGGTLCFLPVFLAGTRPGHPVTRYTIAIAQVMFSSLLIQVTGGRIETHFHVFGSLAFLATYRDWKILIPATAVVAVDHFVRGVFWPETVFGIATASEWRWVEHAGWVIFEDIILIYSIRLSTAEMRSMAIQTARLESSHAEQQTYSERLTRSYEKERAIIEGALDAVVQLDRTGTIVSWNTQAERVFGWTAADMLGKSVSQIIATQSDRQDHLEGLRRYCETGYGPTLNQRRELEGRRRNGESFPIEAALTPIHGGDETLFCAFIRDITDRKRYEEELRLSKAQAEAANRTKSAFLANMSHEIRTPLSGILGFTDLLIRDADAGESERRDYVQTIRTSGQHLLALINDILDLSKIEAGQMQVEHTACSPHQLIAEIVSTLRPRAQEKGIGLDYRWESAIPETVESDPHRLRQLLMNLVGNAVKFTEQGRVDVVATLLQDGDSPRLVFEIRDTGIGVSPENLQKIFTPFVQADSSTTRKYGGTGLGLAICKNIAEALGGELTVQSEVGRGTTFVATLPLGDLAGVRLLDRPPEHVSGDVAGFGENLASLDGVRVLLADDGETNRKLIKLLLSRQGADVVTVENGELACAAVVAQEFDVILMDMQMPVMDGYAAARKLRDSGYGGPLFALTANAMRGDRKKCLEAGCSGYVSKPVDMDVLIREMKAALKMPGNANAANGDAQPPSMSASQVDDTLPSLAG